MLRWGIWRGGGEVCIEVGEVFKFEPKVWCLRFWLRVFSGFGGAEGLELGLLLQTVGLQALEFGGFFG